MWFEWTRRPRMTDDGPRTADHRIRLYKSYGVWFLAHPALKQLPAVLGPSSP